MEFYWQVSGSEDFYFVGVCVFHTLFFNQVESSTSCWGYLCNPLYVFGM